MATKKTGKAKTTTRGRTATKRGSAKDLGAKGKGPRGGTILGYSKVSGQLNPVTSPRAIVIEKR